MRSALGVLMWIGLVSPAPAAVLDVSSATVPRSGDVAEVCVALASEGAAVAGVRTDLTWDGTCATLSDASACRVVPATGKQLFTRIVAQPDFTLRALVLSLTDVAPLADGPLYCCDVRVEARGGQCCAIGIAAADASDPRGEAVAVAVGPPAQLCAVADGGGDGCQIGRPGRASAWPSLPAVLLLWLMATGRRAPAPAVRLRRRAGSAMDAARCFRST